MVLNGRTASGGYGQTSFSGAALRRTEARSVTTWEVLMQDCKFHGHSDNGPGLLVTWRADSSRWNVTAPSGRNLAKGVSVTHIACMAASSLVTTAYDYP